ncbi:protein argonaute 4A [Citrus sinensis]|nr:protein argonaute 4A [Citrus sinensis]
MKFPKDSEAHGPSPSEIPPNVESSQIKSVTGPEVALFYDDGCPIETKGIRRKIIDKVCETYSADLAEMLCSPGGTSPRPPYTEAILSGSGNELTSMVTSFPPFCPIQFSDFQSKSDAEHNSDSDGLDVPTGAPSSNGTIIPIPIPLFPLLVYLHSRSHSGSTLILYLIKPMGSSVFIGPEESKRTSKLGPTGEKSLFTISALPHKKMEFLVLLDNPSSYRTTSNDSPDGHGSNNERDRKRRRVSQSKTFKVEISVAAKIPLQAIAAALHGQESQNSREAFRVLDIILRQHAAKQGCFLVRQSFFQNEPRSFFDLGGGVLGCWGFHSSFQATQGGLSLNIEYRITGLSDSTCKRQMFSWKSGVKDRNDDVKCVDVTVFDYFVNHRRINLCFSGDFPCIDVGKPRKPTYIPIELCSLLSLQRYTKALTVFQRSALVEKSQQKPQEKMKIITDVMRSNKNDSEPMLRSCGISINSRFAQVEGRILSAPRVKKQGGYLPQKWAVELPQQAKIDHWAVANFSGGCDIRSLCRDLIRFGEMKRISTSPPLNVFEENPQFRRAPAPVRVDRMFEQMKQKFEKRPCFLLCLLPDRKDSDLYGSWKRKTLSEFGIFNQCLAPTKLGGLNSLLAIEQSKNLPLVSKVPTIIFGMDVSHGSPGHSNVPSVAAVVSSRNWPILSRYRASVRSQSTKLEMIDSLFKPLPNKDDAGIVRELLVDFYKSSGQTKPSQIIIFRLPETAKTFSYHHNSLPETVKTFNYYHNSSLNLMSIFAQGTTRPTHYHVLLDQIGFSVDDLSTGVGSFPLLCISEKHDCSIFAPVRYAHLAAAQFSQFMKFDDLSEISSSPGGQTSSGHAHVPALPKLHENVRSSMFFC